MQFSILPLMHRALPRRVLSAHQFQQTGLRRWLSFSPNRVCHHGLCTIPSVALRSMKCLSSPIRYSHSFVHHTEGDTIYALSTPKGKAGIAVIRISGPACKDVYWGLCPDTALPKPRYATVRALRDPVSKDAGVLDSQALVLYFPSPRTVTGEDVLELHIHGGSATIKAVLSAIPKANGNGVIRYAEPGEFTKRAFLHDRLDLAQVEALGEMLSAETEQQRRASVRGHSGALGRIYDDWRCQLLHARAEMEALIDFSEDQHFDESPADLAKNVTTQICKILNDISIHEAAGQRSELIRKGIKIALVGPPNVGKSSLMNQLLGREASIVSEESGTTRDIVEANLDIRGYLCTFADTAGFRTEVEDSHFDFGTTKSALGAIEREGIRRARAKAQESDLVVVLASVEKTAHGEYEIYYDQDTLQLAASSPKSLVVVNKRETVAKDQLEILLDNFQKSALQSLVGTGVDKPVLVSCKEAQDQIGSQNDPGGIGAVADALVSLFSDMTSLPADLQELHGVTERQRQLLEKCRESLEGYMEIANVLNTEDETASDADMDITMAAEHLRWAANSLSRITGRGDSGDVEEVLGVIFEKFCVGK